MKKRNKSNKAKKSNVANWIFSIFCMTALPIYGIGIGSILLLLVGIFSLPIEPIKNVWKKVPFFREWMRPIAVAVIFMGSLLLLPETETTKEAPKEIAAEVLEEEKEEKPETDSKKEEKEDVEVKKEENGKAEASAKENEPSITKIDTSSKENSGTSEKQQESSEKAEAKSTEEVAATPKETTPAPADTPAPAPSGTTTSVSLAEIPAYSGKPYAVINNNVPFFTDAELTTTSYETYSSLDALGRCGVVHASIGRDLMPTEERGNIGSVKPTGWQTVKYDIVDGKYLYNRCHLIGFQLSGENANKMNLITGTRSMNVDGMLPFENMVADFVQETGTHVMYRVTPMYEGDNLLATGVLMEAKSVEDQGEGILFNVFVYNVQPGVIIDYKTGNSALENNGTPAKEESSSTTGGGSVPAPQAQAPVVTPPVEQAPAEPAPVPTPPAELKIIANKNSKAYHTEYCSTLPKEKNRVYFNSEAEANAAGYDNPCDRCKP